MLSVLMDVAFGLSACSTAKKTEQSAQDHPEEQVEPPACAEMEPERRERPSVEEASRQPHGQDGRQQAYYATDQRERGGIRDHQGIESAGWHPPAGIHKQPPDHDQAEDDLDEHPIGPVLDSQPPQRSEPSCTPIEKQFQAASACFSLFRARRVTLLM